MAEIHGEELTHHHGGSSAHGGFMADLKAHKIEVIIGGVTLLVTLYFVTRGKSGAPAATKSNGTGTLNSGAPTGSAATTSGVSADQLAAAMTALSGQEQTDLQSIQQQLAAFGQTIAGLGHSASGSNGAGSLPGYPGGNNLPGGQGYPGSGPVVTGNGNAITNALQARNKIGDTNITSFFANLSLPSWIGLQYVAENFALPWTPGSTPTSSQLSNFNNWLNTHGYRNASTGTFTPIVSSGTVPANVQAENDQAYGG
jgi:hypothetical protein